MNQQIDKPDYNEEYRVCNFSTVLADTDTVTGASATIQDKAKADMSATMLAEITVSADSKGIRYKLKGGTSGEKYTLSLQVMTLSNQKFEEEFTVCIL